MRGYSGGVLYSKKRFIFRIVFILSFALASIFIYTQNVLADQFSWVNGSPTVISTQLQSNREGACKDFHYDLDIANIPDKKNGCLYDGGNIKFAYYYEGGSSYPGAISFGFDRKMYKVNDVCGEFGSCLYLPQTDTMVVKYYVYPSYKQGLAIYKDFSKKLSRVTDSFGQTTAYGLTPNTQPDFIFSSSTGYNWPVGALGASEDGGLIVAEMKGRGMLLINTSNFVVKKFSNKYYSYNTGSSPEVQFALSDDGKNVAVIGQNVDPEVYELNSVCGTRIVDDHTAEDPTPQPCDKVSLVNSTPSFSEGLRNTYDPEFSYDGVELKFFAAYNNPSENKVISLIASGASDPEASRLDYLALGDSYSSGEGDTEINPQTRQKYYLPFTDLDGSTNTPREKCHISSRSYPFLLKESMGLSNTKMKSVACSGALARDDFTASKNYFGQNRRLEGFSTQDLKDQAIGSFIPGRVQQLEFVKKYHPKVITLTAGGNDVGFSKKVEACVHPISGTGTCDWANLKRASLGNQIRGQFDSLVSLYVKIKNMTSSKSKIYAIGYPQFITDLEPASCGRNVGNANNEERKMIVQATNYMNQIIQAAASKAGVQYIGIDDSLSSGKLCDDGQEYVTGISDYGNQESYHPNSNGHWKIAQKIKQFLGDGNLQNYPMYPSNGNTNIVAPTSAYFASEMAEVEIKNTQNTQMSNYVGSKNTQQSQVLGPYTFKPNSVASRHLRSDPIDLGDVIANEDGSLDTIFNIPNNVPVGYHTLIIQGESYSGEPIELTQTMLVTGDNPNDLDENNILDRDQPCGAFLDTTNEDKDFDEIDDACDPQISQTQPYRVRNGNPQKNENSDYMYVERDVRATSFTEISGDYDPDNDGWSIVAQSTKPKNSGTPAHFWIDEQRKPHVSVRTRDRGCVQFTPGSLKKIKPNKLRKLKTEIKNTDTCRSEPLSADTDIDGVPDNRQVLYRARNGSQLGGEDPASIYLERNPIASEAQLGLSDYLHSNSWNLLAMSHNDATKANFVKLVMVTNEDGTKIPTILASQTKVNNKGKVTITCIALQPQNTNVIIINNQDGKLKKVLMPQGESCE